MNHHFGQVQQPSTLAHAVTTAYIQNGVHTILQQTKLV